MDLKEGSIYRMVVTAVNRSTIDTTPTAARLTVEYALRIAGADVFPSRSHVRDFAPGETAPPWEEVFTVTAPVGSEGFAYARVLGPDNQVLAEDMVAITIRAPAVTYRADLFLVGVPPTIYVNLPYTMSMCITNWSVADSIPVGARFYLAYQILVNGSWLVSPVKQPVDFLADEYKAIEVPFTPPASLIGKSGWASVGVYGPDGMMLLASAKQQLTIRSL